MTEKELTAADKEKLMEQYQGECREAEAFCKEQGWPSRGSNYDLMVENIRENYPELFDAEESEPAAFHIEEQKPSIAAFVIQDVNRDIDDESLRTFAPDIREAALDIKNAMLEDFDRLKDMDAEALKDWGISEAVDINYGYFDQTAFEKYIDHAEAEFLDHQEERNIEDFSIE